MSLINDALKRASEAEKRRAGIRPGARRGPKGLEALGPPIEPIKKARPSVMTQPSFWMAMFTITLVCVSGAFFYTWWTARTPRFKLHVPPGKDALEMMIVETRPKPKPVEPGVIVVGADGEIIGIPGMVDGTDDTNETSSVAGGIDGTNLVTSTNVVIEVVKTNTPDALVVATNTGTSLGPDKHPGLPVGEPKIPQTTAKTNVATIMKPTTLPSLGPAVGTQDGEVVAEPDKIPGKEETTVESGDSEPFPEIQLKGIVIMKDKATAFVNGKTMKVGEHIDKAELVEIGIEYVKFKLAGEVRQFYLLR